MLRALFRVVAAKNDAISFGKLYGSAYKTRWTGTPMVVGNVLEVAWPVR